MSYTTSTLLLLLSIMVTIVNIPTSLAFVAPTTTTTTKNNNKDERIVTNIIQEKSTSPHSSSTSLSACRFRDGNDGQCRFRSSSKKACRSSCPAVLSEERLLLSDETNFNLLEVWYDGLSCTIRIHQDETILDAIERESVMDRLCMTHMPADCRRGNCLSCVGRVVVKEVVSSSSSSQSNTTTTTSGTTLNTPLHLQTNDNIASELNMYRNIKRDDMDGLPPEKSEKLRYSDQFLLCSSYVTGPGVSITLGDNEDGTAFVPFLRRQQQSSKKSKRKKKQHHSNKDEIEEQQRIATAAIAAKVYRIHSEQNIDSWKAKTERLISNVDDDEEEDYDNYDIFDIEEED